jgi:REP element-mobilizing transposase RayT
MFALACGVPLRKRRSAMPRSRYRIANPEAPHFLTATVNHWLPVFTRPETVDIVLAAWRFLQRDSGFALYGYVILENHIHFIAASADLGRDLRRFKSWTAREIVAHLEARGAQRMLGLLALFKRRHKTESLHQVWEEGNHPQIIESEDVLRQKLEYIHMNPVKRGYVDHPEDWRYSSARNYAGRPGLIEVVRAW